MRTFNECGAMVSSFFRLCGDTVHADSQTVFIHAELRCVLNFMEFNTYRQYF